VLCQAPGDDARWSSAGAWSGEGSSRTAKRALPRKHLVEHRAKTEHIRTLVEQLSLHLFRRHIGCSPDDCAFGRLCDVRIGMRHQLSQSKIEQLGRALPRHQDVAGLEIAMKNASSG